ncbi:MAG: alpha-mannosidase, partial [Chloroflexi bacterium]
MYLISLKQDFSQMPPKLNPLPQLIPNRILMLRNLLREKLWDARQDVDVVTSAVFDTPVPLVQAAALSYRPISAGEYFGEPHGEWQQCWFRTEIPPAAAGQSGRRYFFWDCRGESTVFIDGQPWAGLDVAHPYCILPDRACTLWIDCGTYQTCIWFDNGKPIDQYGLRFDGAWIACRNPAAWETYWDLDVLVEWMLFLLKRDGLENMARPWGPIPELGQAHPVLRKLIGMFDDAFAAWEKGGASTLGLELKRIYAAFPGESWQPKVKMIGHSHLDLVWMWPEYVGERKAVHTMATAMRLLEEYPQYRFMWTSPHSMKMIENQFPGLYGAVKQKIQDGRWEATGGAWVEFDTLIACGEALGRSLALGQLMFEKLRGSISTTVWLPDCFGFNGFLPQIMAQAGIKNFYTTKLSWSVVTEFPYDSFIWRAADGSEVITHLNAAAPSGESLTGMVEASRSYRQLDVDNEILKYTGVGDGGGGTTVDRMEWFNRLGSLAQVPSVEWGSVEGFFEQLGQKRDRLPVFEGELYLEFHRGIYTTESEYKRVYRRMERSLQAWEAARALTGA